MKFLKQVIRLVIFIVSIAIASFGMMGNLLAPPRDKFMNTQIRIEQIDKKDDEEGEDGDEVKS